MKIIHDEEQQIFYCKNDEKLSFIRYTFENGAMNLIFTYVPPENRHKGLAALLVKAALEYAKEKSMKVIPTCSYVDYFIDRNKEYEKLLKA